MDEYDFKLVWEDPPRSISRVQWKEIQRWLRIFRRRMLKQWDEIKSAPIEIICTPGIEGSDFKRIVDLFMPSQEPEDDK